jgi:mannose-6-phosphate isomerase-like protein (cupin superfamily)
MERFATISLPVEPNAIALDGSDVRVLLRLNRGSLAHFEVRPGATSVAISHHTIEEIWYFLNGRGQIWRKLGDQEEIITVEKGVCITIPTGTQYQFRTLGDEPLSAVGVTMPPWPGEGEAYEVHGIWESRLTAGECT